nr:gag pol polyprotein [Hymenolepis microstoma]
MYAMVSPSVLINPSKNLSTLVEEGLAVVHEPSFAKETRHLDFISQFTNDIQHIDGASNVIADGMATDQRPDPDFTVITSNPLLPFECLPLPDSNTQIHCDVSAGKPRPFVPQAHSQKIFYHFHGLPHPSIRSTTNLIPDRLFEKKIRQDVRQWAKNCLTRQARNRYPMFFWFKLDGESSYHSSRNS